MNIVLDQSSILSIFTSLLVIVSFFVLFILFLLKFQNKNIDFFQILVPLMVISGVVGPAFFAVDLGFISIFPLRIILIIIYIYVALYLINKNSFDLSVIRVQRYLMFFIIWFSYAAISLVWATSKIDGVRNIFILGSSISIVFFCVIGIKKIKQLDKLFHIWIIILAILLIIGTWNTLTGNHLSISGLANAADRHRFAPTTVFVNPNNFATYLALSIPFLLTYIKYSDFKFKYLLGSVLLIQTIYLIVATDSRANFIALTVGMIFWLLLLTNIKSKLKLLFVIPLLVSIGYFNQGINSTVDKIFDGVDISSYTNEAELQGSSVDIRNNLLKNSFQFIVDSYGLGVGAGNIEYQMANNFHFYTSGVLNVHNWWAELLVNYGILIFLLYVIFVVSIFYNLLIIVRDKNISKTEKKLGETFITVVIIFIVSSISASSLIDFGPQWILWGMILVYVNIMRSKWRSSK